MDKFECYGMLSRIASEKGIDVSEYIKSVAVSGVNESVLSFIKMNSDDSNDSTNDVYEMIYSKRRNNPLYKSLVNEDLSIEDKAIALSSLLTQMSINTKSTGSKFKNSDVITESLNRYFNGDRSMINDTHELVRSEIKEYVSKSRGDANV